MNAFCQCYHCRSQSAVCERLSDKPNPSRCLICAQDNKRCQFKTPSNKGKTPTTPAPTPAPSTFAPTPAPTTLAPPPTPPAPPTPAPLTPAPAPAPAPGLDPAPYSSRSIPGCLQKPWMDPSLENQYLRLELNATREELFLTREQLRLSEHRLERERIHFNWTKGVLLKQIADLGDEPREDI